MPIHPFELLFDPPRSKPPPDSARGQIAVSAHSTENGRMIVSHGDCRTVTEVEEAVNYLKKDLDRILAEAHRKFPQRQGGTG